MAAGAHHLLDLPPGYHATPPAQAWQTRPTARDGMLRRGCPAVGRCQVEEMTLRLPRVERRSIPGADHLSVAVSRRHPVTRIRSSPGHRMTRNGERGTRQIRLRDEEVAGSDIAIVGDRRGIDLSGFMSGVP
jgi:hypothetical protein